MFQRHAAGGGFSEASSTSTSARSSSGVWTGCWTRPPVPKSFPYETPPELRDKVIALSLEHPRLGSFADQRSSPAAGGQRQSQLGEESLGQRGHENPLQAPALPGRGKARPGTGADRRADPALGESQPLFSGEEGGKPLSRISALPGHLCRRGPQGDRPDLPAGGGGYLRFLTFGKLYTSKLPENAVDLLYDRVLPFYLEQGLEVEHILTDNGRQYCGRAMIHPYQIFLDLNDIEHRRTQVARPRTNGFVERFNRTILDEFFREAFRNKFYASVEELQEDVDQWLHHYNHERPHRGCRNMGRRPIETIEQGKVIRDQRMKLAA